MPSTRCGHCGSDYVFHDARYDVCPTCGVQGASNPLWQDYPQGLPATSKVNRRELARRLSGATDESKEAQRYWRLYRAQRVLQISFWLGLLAIVGVMVLLFLPALHPLIFLFVLFGFGAFVGITIGTLMGMHALGHPWPVLLILLPLLFFFPGMCLFPLAVLGIWVLVSTDINRAFRKIGLRPGLFGVSYDRLAIALSGRYCRVCNYDLTGNVSGICPECGTPVGQSERPKEDA